ncbi:MAG: transglutaminase-like domain-containing protein [Planctomycetota bacterium]
MKKIPVRLPMQLMVLAIGGILCGCEKPKVRELAPVVPKNSSSEAEVQEPESKPEDLHLPARQWLAEEDFPIEQWHIQYFGGKQVGYFKTEISKGETLFHIRRLGVLEQRTEGQIGQYTIELDSYEYPDGQFSSFSQLTQYGPEISKVSGDRIGKRLNLETANGPNIQRTSIDWKEGTWGVLGLQSVLQSSKIEPGEKRTCEVFLPSVNQIASVELIAGSVEQVALPGSQRELVPIEVTMRLGEQSSASRNWVDENGLIHKTVLIGNQTISTFLAPPEVGKSIAAEMQCRVLADRKVKFYGVSPSLEHRSALYVVEAQDSEIYKRWDNQGRQDVKSLTALSAQVKILDAQTEQLHWKALASSEAYLSSSEWLSSEHESIQRLLAELKQSIANRNISAGTENPNAITAETTEAVGVGAEQPQFAIDSREAVLRIAMELKQVIREAPQRTTFSTALQTLRTAKGDSKDQTLLLAAILRSAGVPTRIAFGVKLDAPLARFGPQVWTEAWVDESWVSIDAYEGQEIGVDSLKMFDDALEGNPYSLWLQLLNTMEGISIRLVSSE